MITPEALAEFKKLYFQEYSIELTDQKVLEYGTKLIGLVRAVYGRNLPKRVLDIGENKSHD